MKNYTDLEQSKKLAEILPLDSADMHYNDWKFDFYDGYEHTGEYLADLGTPVTICNELDIPCWSLAALLEVIRHNGRYELQMYEGGYYFEANGFMTESYFNPIDACVEMIIKLKENKLL